MLTRNSRTKSLRLERLEGRDMLAGNVTATLMDHTLLIHGDNSGNAIIVTQTGKKSFTVVQDPANPTTINGVTGGSFSADRVKRVEIITGTGNDSVTINGDRLRKGDINLGDGNNTLVINSSRVDKLNVTTGSGSDDVTIASTRIKRANVSLGAGDDSLTFTKTLPREKSTVDGGTGTNTLTTPGNVITADGTFRSHHPHYRLTVENFTFA
jgi:hypothetical protein